MHVDLRVLACGLVRAGVPGSLAPVWGLWIFQLVGDIPPDHVVLRPFNGPNGGHILPLGPLTVVRCVVVLSHCDRGDHFTPRWLGYYGRLGTLSRQCVRVHVAIRRRREHVCLIHVRRQTLFCGGVEVTPQVAVHRKGFAMQVSPVSFPPVANVVASANVESNHYGGVNLYLRMLYRRTTVKYACATCFLIVSGDVFFAGLLYAFCSVLYRPYPDYVSITNEGFLSRANDATEFCRVRRVTRYHMYVVQVATFRVATSQATPAVVVRGREVFPINIGVEQRMVAAVGNVAAEVNGAPNLTFTRLRVFRCIFAWIFRRE